MSTLENALLVARTLSELPFERNLWQAQNLWYDMYLLLHKTLTQTAKVLSQEAAAGAETQGTGTWEEKFREVGRLLGISVDELVIEEETPALEAASPATATVS
jgi:hypothetical protein